MGHEIPHDQRSTLRLTENNCQGYCWAHTCAGSVLLQIAPPTSFVCNTIVQSFTSEWPAYSTEERIGLKEAKLAVAADDFCLQVLEQNSLLRRNGVSWEWSRLHNTEFRNLQI
jgi:hypothetical protein